MKQNYIPTRFNRPLIILFIGFCLLLPNIHLSLLASQVVIPREFFLYLYSIVFILFLTQQKRLRFNAFFILAGIFFVWQCLALIWSSDRQTGIESVLNAYIFLLTGYTFYQISDSHIRSVLLNTLLGSVSFACLIGILQNFGWNSDFIFQAEPPSSTFVNKNLASSAALLLLPLAMMRLMQCRVRIHKILFFTAATLILSYILIAHTKGVWLAGIAIAGITLLSYLFNRDRGAIRMRLEANRLALAGVVLISLVLFLAPGIRNTGSFDPAAYSLTSGSGSVRLGFYRDALPLIAQNPLTGIGSGSLRHDFRAEPGGDYRLQHAEGGRYLARLHNDHLQYLVEHGMVGLALWLAMVFALFRLSWRQLQTATASLDEKLIQFSLLTGITGMLIHAFVSFPLRSVSTGSLFWIMLGLLFSFQREGERAHAFALQSPAKYTLVPVLLIASILSMHNITNRAIGSYFTKLTSEMLVSGYCFAAVLFMKNAMDVTSLDLRSAQLLALTHDYCGGESLEKTNAAMNRILEFEPNHAQALLVKGDVAIKLGDTEAARAYYAHALKVNPLEPRTYLGLAKIAGDEDDRKTAVELLQRLLLIDSQNAEAEALLSRYTTS